jgi:hypothetical protein
MVVAETFCIEPLLDGSSKHYSMEYCTLQPLPKLLLQLILPFQMMKELVASGNALTKLMVTALAPSLPGATVGVYIANCALRTLLTSNSLGYFDSYSFFDSMYKHPQLYFNGTAPLNVTSAVRHCVFAEGEDTGDTGNCTVAEGTDKDSFLWHDELHPSEQTDRVVARAVSDLILGKSQKWTTFFHGPKK